jgi:anti-sigma regulatory factor (Ser/Thr protein kinase)
MNIASSRKGFVHQALIYASEQAFVDDALPYVREGIRAGEPVLARVKAVNADALREALGAEAREVDLRPAEGWYETPIRTRGKFLGWISDHLNGHRIRLLGEPPWPQASQSGIREWARHEAITNIAFDGSPVTFVCPYDAHALPPAIIEHAQSTHPEIRDGAGITPSERFWDPRAYCRRIEGEVRGPSGSPSAQLRFGLDDLSSMRRLVEIEAMQSGVAAERIPDIVAAVNEVATNALVHGEDPTSMEVWHGTGELVVAVRDSGHGFIDPFAGQLRPDPSGSGGWGMWLARMLSDAIEVHSTGSGTVVEIHASVSQS